MLPYLEIDWEIYTHLCIESWALSQRLFPTSLWGRLAAKRRIATAYCSGTKRNTFGMGIGATVGLP